MSAFENTTHVYQGIYVDLELDAFQNYVFNNSLSKNKTRLTKDW